jgi:hypothetical protein
MGVDDVMQNRVNKAAEPIWIAGFSWYSDK